MTAHTAHHEAKPHFAPRQRFDRSLFTVIRDYGKLGLESQPLEPTVTAEQIAADIASGQIDRVVAVIEFNPIEGWSSDITVSIAEQVDALMALRTAAE